MLCDTLSFTWCVMLVSWGCPNKEPHTHAGAGAGDTYTTEMCTLQFWRQKSEIEASAGLVHSEDCEGRLCFSLTLWFVNDHLHVRMAFSLCAC